MAIETASNNETTSAKDKKKADGYLNLQIKGADGTMYQIPAYISLDKEKRVHRALLNKAAAAGKDHTFEIVGTVVIAEDQPEIEL